MMMRMKNLWRLVEDIVNWKNDGGTLIPVGMN